MPGIICLSPTLLDQTFPRSEDELYTVAEALGHIIDIAQHKKAYLLLTEVFEEFIEEFEWQQRPASIGILTEIHRVFSQWFLRRHNKLAVLKLNQIRDYSPHPVPIGQNPGPLVDLWSDEMGRLLKSHDVCIDSKKFFIGVACERKIVGDDSPGYPVSEQRIFPLVDQNGICVLEDAFEWEIPQDIHQKEVSFASAKKNIRIIGAVSVEKPKGGSHYSVKFDGARTWVLDSNNDPIPERFLKELSPITGLPVHVIKAALISGSLPARRLRLLRDSSCEVTHCPSD